MDVQNLDLLSPAARRDLEALQSSGLEDIHYPGFLVEVSSGHLRADLGRSEEPTEEVGWGTVSPHLGHPLSLTSLGPLLLGMSPDPVPRSATPTADPPRAGEGSECAPTQPQVSLSMVLNPLLLQRLVGRCLSVGLHQRVPHFFFPPFLMENVSYISQFQVKPIVTDVLLQ